MPGRRWAVSKELIKINRFTNEASYEIAVQPEKSEVVLDNPANQLELHKVSYALRHPNASRLLDRRRPSLTSHASNQSHGFRRSKSYDVAEFARGPREASAYSSESSTIKKRLHRFNTDPLSVGLLSKVAVPDLGDIAVSQPSRMSSKPSVQDVEESTVLNKPDLLRSDADGLKELLFQWIHLLNFVLPFALGNWGFDANAVFFLNLIGLVPLSLLLADATDQAAIGLGSDVLACLLNATLGNATEMIVTVTSLRAGLYDVVKSSMLGSILSNLLVVLGTTIIAGGLKHSKVAFSVNEPLFSVSLLLLGSMSFSLPTFFFFTNTDFDEDYIVTISRAVSVVTAITYAAYIGNQMFIPAENSADDQKPIISMTTSVLLLGAATYMIGLVSDGLVNTITGLVDSTTLSAQFVAVVLLPLAGNVQGILQGIALARNGGTNIAIALALAGCTQVALMVLPFAVIAGWVLEKPMDLKFDIMEVFVLVLSVLVAFSVVVYGHATWLHGFVLCTTYCTLTILFWSK